MYLKTYTTGRLSKGRKTTLTCWIFTRDFYDTAQRRTFTKPLINLTGTEQCLPANLVTSSQIGDPNTCACDVMVLSFRVQCRDRTPHDQSHISYLFDPNTGWRLGIGKKCAFFCRNAEKTELPLLHIP